MEEEKTEMERLNEEAKQEESKSGKTGMGRGGRSKEGVWIGCLAMVFRCVSLLVPLVPVVLVLFSDVNVIGEVV